MYLIHNLLTRNFEALNILSPPAGNAISTCSNATFECVSISRLGETKTEMDTVDKCVYYMLCKQITAITAKKQQPNNYEPLIGTPLYEFTDMCH